MGKIEKKWRTKFKKVVKANFFLEAFEKDRGGGGGCSKKRKGVKQKEGYKKKVGGEGK